jgi:hypothetical protein
MLQHLLQLLLPSLPHTPAASLAIAAAYAMVLLQALQQQQLPCSLHKPMQLQQQPVACSHSSAAEASTAAAAAA